MKYPAMIERKVEGTLPRPQRWFPLVRHFSRPTTRLLQRWPINPNQITSASLILGIAGAAMFRSAEYPHVLAASALLVGCYVLDNCDGEIARLKNLSSDFGKRFDTFVDWIVHATFFVCLGWGVTERTSSEIWLWFGILTALGGTINYIIDIKKDVRDRLTGMDKVEDGPGQSAVDRIVYASRVIRTDFCFIVFALGLADSVHLLLPAGAIGAQVFWSLQFIKGFRRHHV